MYVEKGRAVGWFVVELEGQDLKTILKTRYAIKELHQVYDTVIHGCGFTKDVPAR